MELDGPWSRKFMISLLDQPRDAYVIRISKALYTYLLVEAQFRVYNNYSQVSIVTTFYL